LRRLILCIVISLLILWQRLPDRAMDFLGIREGGLVKFEN